MLTSSSCSPVARSTPVIMAPSMSFLSSAASAFLAALGDDLVDHLVHEGDVAGEIARGASASTDFSSGRPRIIMMVSSERTSDSTNG